MAKKVVIKQDPDLAVPTEVIATAIESIAEGVRKLRSGRLTDDALVLLITNASPAYGGKYNKSKVGSLAVRAVLEGMENLEREYLKPKKGK
jgi:hypothetical protein